MSNISYFQITSRQSDKVKYFQSLNNKKNRLIEQEFLVEGLHLVEEANNLNLLKAIITTDPNYFINSIENYLVTPDIIAKIAMTKTPQPVIGVVVIPKYTSYDFNKYLILDDISDPGNLGTIIRTAVAFNVDCIIVSENTVDIYNDKVIRATQGAIFKIPIIKLELINIILKLKAKKIPLIVTSLDTDNTLDNLVLADKYALVMGNEAHGVSIRIQELADQLIRIPMAQNTESLNVSVALGIVLYAINNNRAIGANNNRAIGAK